MASVETPTVVVRPPDPSVAVAQMALRAAVRTPPLLGGGGGFGGGGGGEDCLYVQQELLDAITGRPPAHVEALAAALRFIV